MGIIIVFRQRDLMSVGIISNAKAAFWYMVYYEQYLEGFGCRDHTEVKSTSKLLLSISSPFQVEPCVPNFPARP